MRARIEVKNGNDELTFEDGLVTLGGRNGCDVVLRDAMVADRHCVIEYEGEFVLRDTGSVVGTWVDGARANPTAALRDGSEIIIGSTRLSVAISDDDGTAVLALASDPQSFWWTKSGKGAFDNDPDQLVYSEARFGRFASLRLGNRLAAVLGSAGLFAAIFATSVMEPLADAGPLLAAHALTQQELPPDFTAGASGGGESVHGNLQRCVELAGEQGCNVCHTTGSGTPEAKCAQCHGLPGEMAAEGSWRHPYHNDGSIADQQFCVVCHTDHAGPKGMRKAASDQLVGDCAACHDKPGETFDRDALIASATMELPAPVQLAFEQLKFPHDQHLSQNISCEVCHRIDDDVRARFDAGLPDNPSGHDFTSVPYEVCASCHVADAAPVQMTAAQQEKWRAIEFQWRVRWHGTDDGGDNCMQCHDGRDADGDTVFGPDLKMVARPAIDEANYRSQRARYTTQSRAHDEQFAEHAGGQACTKCHLDGQILDARGSSDSAAPVARTFWHGLHLANAAMTPNRDDAGTISRDSAAGCASCHADLARPDALQLTPASEGAYHWPGDEASQKACTSCHDGGAALTALTVAVPAASSQEVPDFPHGPHVASELFGNRGSLAKGCYACHEFSEPLPGEPFTQLPQTKPEARSCTQCHSGHDDIAGGSCQQCHPKVENESNSFLVQAKVFDPPWPTREWPAPNGFRHLSAGHVNEDCAACHGQSGLERAGALGDVRVPDEGAKLCRDCHLEKQFHWR
ncbi:MAG: FHA domain-containing protein [Planctomycetota bacterium]